MAVNKERKKEKNERDNEIMREKEGDKQDWYESAEKEKGGRARKTDSRE